MRFDLWQSKQNILFGGSNLSHLYFSGQLCWKFRFGNFNFGLLDWSFSGSALSFAVDVSAVCSLCCCPKNAESLLCFDITLHSWRSCPFLSKFTMIISIIINTLQKNNNFCVIQDNKKTSYYYLMQKVQFKVCFYLNSYTIGFHPHAQVRNTLYIYRRILLPWTLNRGTQWWFPRKLKYIENTF